MKPGKKCVKRGFMRYAVLISAIQAYTTVLAILLVNSVRISLGKSRFRSKVGAETSALSLVIPVIRVIDNLLRNQRMP